MPRTVIYKNETYAITRVGDLYEDLSDNIFWTVSDGYNELRFDKLNDAYIYADFNNALRNRNMEMD